MSLFDERVIGLIKEAYQLETEKANINEKLKEINGKIELIAIEVHKAFSLDDDPELILNGIGKVTVTLDPKFNVLVANKPELIRRFKEDPSTAGLVKEEINPISLKSYLQEATRETGEMPHADIISRYDRPVIKFKKQRS